MPDLRFIKPAPGLTVNREDGQPLAAEGETLAWSSWWARRLRDGDVIVGQAAPAKIKGDSK